MEKQWVSFEEALKLTEKYLTLMPPEVLPLHECAQRIAAEDVYAKINSPSLTASLKDGYAVHSSDVASASEKTPVDLLLAGTVAAGETPGSVLEKGRTIRILTGAPLPEGAEAVVSQEFTREDDQKITFFADAEPGRNVLPKGTDVTEGEQIVHQGETLTAGHAGLLAAAGLESILVRRLPRVAIIATGDEIIAPGEPFRSGAIFASNLITLSAFLRFRNINVVTKIIKDRPDQIKVAISALLGESDVLLTIGGAWEGDKDYTLQVLQGLGWKAYYHRVRIGPGKAVSFGILQDKPVFCLPGGPPSNEMAFLQLAFPAVLAMSGDRSAALTTTQAVLTEEVRGQLDWTQFIYAELREKDGEQYVTPLVASSRLKSMARARALIKIPEGEEVLPQGKKISIQLLV
jgi:molybdopterin molybdotransferase